MIKSGLRSFSIAILLGGCSSAASPSPAEPPPVTGTPAAPGPAATATCVDGEAVCDGDDVRTCVVEGGTATSKLTPCERGSQVCRAGACASISQEQRDWVAAVDLTIASIEGVAGLAPELAVDTKALSSRLTREIFHAEPAAVAFYRALRQVALAYPIGHLAVMARDACGTLEHPFTHESRLGVCVQPYRDHAVVSYVSPSNPLGLVAGDEIVGVDGKVGAAMMEASLTQPLCGSSWASESNRRYVAATSLFAGAKSGMRVELKHLDGTTETKVVDKTTSSVWCSDPFARPWEPLASSYVRPDGIGVIRVASFSLGAAGAALSFEQLMAQIRAQLATAFDAVKTAPGLVWDLRANAGGSTYNGLEIVSGTAGAKVGTETGAYRTRNPGTTTFTDRDAIVLSASSAFSYAGKVAMVTDGLTISAADYTARAAKLASNIVLVGAPTAGAYGGGTNAADVGAKVSVLLSADPYRGEDKLGARLEGQSVEPSVAVELDPHDLAKGIDTVLEAAVAHVKP
jgi:C-terminal processing protease CtpA/Prc